MSRRGVSAENLRKVVHIAVVVAVISVCAQIAIPLFVPVTLQVFGVLLAGFLLGPRYGFYAVLIYVVLGLMGLPVFAGFRGGFSVVVSPTFGYIISFPIAAVVAGIFFNANFREIFKIPLAVLAPTAIIYLFGVFYLMIWSRYIAAKPMSLAAALSVGVFPFVGFDIIKGAAAYYLTKKLRPVLRYFNR